jgi:glycosyltransferase involved in cell wall biosynthesis
VRFVSFGRIGERKGQFDLIRAVAELPLEVRRRCRVLLAGDGEVDAAAKLARELGVNDNVEVRGWLEAADRDRALASADAFVLVSRNEGLPMALLEGMAWGLPALSTPVGGIAEVVQPEVNGLLVSPGDVPAIAEALRRLIEDELMRLRMGAAARASIEPLRIERFIDRLREIYRDVLRQAAPSPEQGECGHAEI